MAAEAAACEAATDDAINADATEVEAYVTKATEASSVLTLVHAVAARCLDNRMAAEAAACEAATDCAMNADATEVKTHVTAIAEARTVLTLMQLAQAAAARRVESVMTAEVAADNAMNADATEVKADVTTTSEASTALTLV